VSSGFAIEPMRVDDIPEVVEIERACFAMPWPASAYKRELKNPGATRYLVARHYLTEPPARHDYHSDKRSSLITRLLPFLRQDETEGGEGNSHKNPNPVVGYGGLWLQMDEAHITTLGVTPQYRGKAIGEFLLVGLIDVAMRLGASWLTLEVRVSNNVAQNLYNKYTFKTAGTRYKYYTDNDEDAYIMWSDELTKAPFRETYKACKVKLLERLTREGELAAPIYPHLVLEDHQETTTEPIALEQRATPQDE
jgi:[ribosomal protein S18]-alanine N-acetyltransferase